MKVVTSVSAWAPIFTVPVSLFVKVLIGPARSPVRLKPPVFLTVSVFITPRAFIVAEFVTEVEALMVSVLMKVPPVLLSVAELMTLVLVKVPPELESEEA